MGFVDGCFVLGYLVVLGLIDFSEFLSQAEIASVKVRVIKIETNYRYSTVIKFRVKSE